jgi:hypothetical protein
MSSSSSIPSIPSISSIPSSSSSSISSISSIICNKLLNEYGFDIYHSFNSTWYNDHIIDNHLHDALNKLCDNKYSIIIGNTKLVWNKFIEWIKNDINRIDLDNPFDSYTMYAIDECVSYLKHQNINYKCYYSDNYNKDDLVSMARVSSCSGLCYLDNNTHLAIHETYGSWISFRCVIVFDIEYPADLLQRPIPIHCFLSNDMINNAVNVFQKALDSNNDEDSYKNWIDVRDCINDENQLKYYRFSNDQIEYHYCSNNRKDVLTRCCKDFL